MKQSVFVALLAFATAVSAGTEHGFPLRHRHARRAGHKHHHKKNVELPAVKRAGQCQFPTDGGLVPVAPSAQNAGWAMSPDQPCLPGHYCPYACPPGQVMAQWNPSATSYTYPLSMDGGLYCNPDGSISKPFPNKPYCVDGAGSFAAVNQANQDIAICQTVLPGNEAMLIPTHVGAGQQVTLAVPDTSYWCGTAAHYYINPPGVSTTEGCVWGTAAKPVGNWASFVTGANKASDGNTYVTAGINPIYCCEPANGYSQVDPGYAIRIECPDGGCNGMPCECNPKTMGVNRCTGGSVGAGGAQFCVVTVSPGHTARVVVFSTKDGATISTSPVTGATVNNTGTSDSSSSSQQQPQAIESPSTSSSSTTKTSTTSWSSSSSSASAANITSASGFAYGKNDTWSSTESWDSTATDIDIYPTGKGLGYYQGHPSEPNVTSTLEGIPLAAISSASAAATPTTTSDAEQTFTHASTLLLLTALVAAGMVNM